LLWIGSLQLKSMKLAFLNTHVLLSSVTVHKKATAHTSFFELRHKVNHNHSILPTCLGD
jgi:hypothetical protein